MIKEVEKILISEDEIKDIVKKLQKELMKITKVNRLYCL